KAGRQATSATPSAAAPASAARSARRLGRSVGASSSASEALTAAARAARTSWAASSGRSAFTSLPLAAERGEPLLGLVAALEARGEEERDLVLVRRVGPALEAVERLREGEADRGVERREARRLLGRRDGRLGVALRELDARERVERRGRARSVLDGARREGERFVELAGAEEEPGEVVPRDRALGVEREDLPVSGLRVRGAPELVERHAARELEVLVLGERGRALLEGVERRLLALGHLPQHVAELEAARPELGAGRDGARERAPRLVDRARGLERARRVERDGHVLGRLLDEPPREDGGLGVEAVAPERDERLEGAERLARERGERGAELGRLARLRERARRLLGAAAAEERGRVDERRARVLRALLEGRPGGAHRLVVARREVERDREGEPERARAEEVARLPQDGRRLRGLRLEVGERADVAERRARPEVAQARERGARAGGVVLLARGERDDRRGLDAADRVLLDAA